jgi:hypothetical protein
MAVDDPPLPLDFSTYGHAIGVLAQPHDRKENNILQRSEKLPTRHFFYNIKQMQNRINGKSDGEANGLRLLTIHPSS